MRRTSIFISKSPLQQSILGPFCLIDRTKKLKLAITCPFSLHKHRGTPTGL